MIGGVPVGVLDAIGPRGTGIMIVIPMKPQLGHGPWRPLANQRKARGVDIRGRAKEAHYARELARLGAPGSAMPTGGELRERTLADLSPRGGGARSMQSTGALPPPTTMGQIGSHMRPAPGSSRWKSIPSRYRDTW